jgi:hypothetical protein
MNCDCCGAGLDPGKRMCDFCGYVVLDDMLESDEIALVEQCGSLALDKLPYAYIPTSSGALSAALDQALDKAQGASGNVLSKKGIATASRLLDRSEIILSAMEACPDEGAEELVDPGKAKIKAARKQLKKKENIQLGLKATTFGLVSCLALLFILKVVSAVGDLADTVSDMRGNMPEIPSYDLDSSKDDQAKKKTGGDQEVVEPGSSDYRECREGKESACKTVESYRCLNTPKDCDEVCQLSACYLSCELENGDACDKHKSLRGEWGL